MTSYACKSSNHFWHV